MNDPVARLTPLGVAVLALLSEGDMHPYEMIRLMHFRRDDRLVTITNGTVYHTVGRLERAGLIAEVGVDRDGNRPERTTYTQTDAGAAAVLEWVRRELPRVDRPAEFRVALAEVHGLDRDEAIELLRARRAALAASLESLEDGHRHALDKGVPEQYLIEIGREAALLHAELAWMDAMLPRIADPDFAWGRDEAPSERYLAQRKAARQ
ncbi:MULTISPECIES: PadR family transcriptional regulator [Microbacterium]|uniref:Transcriptional regulator PadR-like family protein n=1 Tax=Microbacterium trichothecenolyticum TaxID=69370 RepID=A0A0M2HFR8_MICTR|nr:MULTISPECIES: PadR family transcriptional regulator [Microbacterium]KJL45518.1 Transcriptional regulator PadR-like family protein [Microbacterium trichothecenolyticum]MDR7188397.1 DNA-binding PadR family transcriptional regulator [Microbacterium sp. BE35]